MRNMASFYYALRSPWRLAAEKHSSGFFFSVTTISEHKEEAFLAIMELFSSETQSVRARISGSYPVVKIHGLEKVLASELAIVKGKNIAGLIPSKFAPIGLSTPQGVNPQTNLTNAFSAVAKGTKDVNTALREAQELTEKQIAEGIAAGNK
ncbi:MAG: hypothetical protein K0Q59_5423 [Paenibacillus sp.]|jgi:multiple sugar transport system substrate-binding protein|nr:hypothetical protein [Paenibacillus sp.]